jgi:hypothetical protein
MNVLPAKFLRTLLARSKWKAPAPAANYDSHVGNSFAAACKFSEKTASTLPQMLGKKGADKRPFRTSWMPPWRQI